jgi:hypothetical protein
MSFFIKKILLIVKCMNLNYIKIYKYYQSLEELNKFIFIDLLNDLIKWFNSVENLKKDFQKSEYKEHIEDILSFINNLWLNKANWFIVYKKTDYTVNKDIANIINIDDSSTISKLTMIRRVIILNLIKYDFLIDLNIWMNSIYSEKEMIEGKYIIIQKDWTKKFDFNQLKISQDGMQIWWNQFKMTKENIWLLLYITMVSQLKTYYWEDELNKELNLDDSYKQILFYKIDKEKLKELLINLFKNWDKEIINKYEFKNKKLYINWNEFKVKDSKKAEYFIELISTYFSWTNKKRLSISDLNDIYIENTKDIKYLTLSANNIKTSYIKTIRKQLWNKYINNEILKIKWNDIVLL